jgi:hypothetical protein
MNRLLPSVALAITPLVVSAQAKSPAKNAPRCGWKPSDAWVARQREFFDDSKHDWSDDTLRTALLQAAGLDGALSAPVQLGVEIQGRALTLGPTATAMTERLKTLAAQRGSTWPTRSVVGGAGVHAVYLLSQSDTGLARNVLHRMMEAGPVESPAADVATFEDHMRLIWGRKQIYGTQFRLGSNGKIELAPMEDSAHADFRREDAGLPPFTVGMCLAKSGS